MGGVIFFFISFYYIIFLGGEGGGGVLGLAAQARGSSYGQRRRAAVARACAKAGRLADGGDALLALLPLILLHLRERKHNRT